MVDCRSIMEQVHELQLIIQEIADEGMKICETFTVNCIMEKLPPRWLDFKNYLCYKQKALTLVSLITRLQNESFKRKSELTFTHNANIVEYKNKGKGKFVHNSSKGASKKIAPQASTSFKKQGEPNKFTGKCYYYHIKGY
ncbi:hypothetical protein V5N11_009077 [Cardamine amara subsp. amara]|uniref:Uncharacterized protein n=1 Tax=Cardamine amara subsp. amara TaxID=228776 RepID=A0ABD1C7H1_CARAN